jgi:aldehyde dehydrogenase (NAD+)
MSNNHLKFYINGQWVDPVKPATIDVVNPATEEVYTKIAAGSAADVDKAVAAARAAFPAFSQTSKAERVALLKRIIASYEKRFEDIAQAVSQEMGAPLAMARNSQAAAGKVHLESTLKALEAMEFEEQRGITRVVREAIGVVGLITPWNWPLNQISCKVGPAIAAGCTMVLKPSEVAPISGIIFAEVMHDAGVPAGVFNLISGDGLSVGAPMSAHPGIDMMSFTGSTAVGKRIAGKAGAALKRVALELGGKAANTVFADADLEAALDGVLFGMILNQGEECCAGSRLLVEQSIARDFVERLVERARKIVVGMPLDERTDIGALIHEQHLEKVLGYVAKGQAEGAQLAIGGDRLRRDGLEKGFFVGPTVLTRVTPAMTVFREEIFGPVLTVTPFDGVEQAVALANDTAFGLANGLWTKDVDKALQVSKRLKSGTVYVNTYLETAPQLPFGGFKQSGIGRENGLDGLLEFTEVKSTFVKLGARPPALPHVHAGPR